MCAAHISSCVLSAEAVDGVTPLARDGHRAWRPRRSGRRSRAAGHKRPVSTDQRQAQRSTLMPYEMPLRSLLTSMPPCVVSPRQAASTCQCPWHVPVPMARASAHSWRLPQGIQSAELPESPSHVPSALPCVQSPGGMAWACFSQRASCQQLRVDCAHHPNRWTRRPRPRHTPRCRRHRPPPAQRLRSHCHPHDLHWWRWQAVPGT